MLSLAAGDAEQGRAMGNNQSLQVGGEGLSGLAGGALAAAMVKLPLLVFAGASTRRARARPRRGAGARRSGARRLTAMELPHFIHHVHPPREAAPRPWHGLTVICVAMSSARWT